VLRQNVGMANVELLLKAWDMAHWEFGEALEGLEDADLWRRPAPALLSVGELIGHMAYCEATRFTGPAVSDDPRGPLVDQVFSYYESQVANRVVLPIGVAQAAADLERIHESAVAKVRDLAPDSEALPPPGIQGMWEGSNWGDLLNYMVFHVAYHTGQAYSARHLIYSARHLIGHRTKDN